MTALGLVVLRLTVAAALVAHGAHQLFGLFGGPGIGPGGLTVAAARYSALGLDPGFPLAVLGGTIELLGGLLVAVGLLTRWASLAVIAILVLDVWKDQVRWGYFLNWSADPTWGNGMEYSILLGGALICLMLTGGGLLSVDGRRESTAAARASARARLRTRG